MLCDIGGVGLLDLPNNTCMGWLSGAAETHPLQKSVGMGSRSEANIVIVL